MMLNHLGASCLISSPSSPPMLASSSRQTTGPLKNTPSYSTSSSSCSTFEALNLNVEVPNIRRNSTLCAARRRVRYEEDEEDIEEEYGHNKEIATLELYSQSVVEEALLVHALVDDQEVEVLVFKVSSFHFSFS